MNVVIIVGDLQVGRIISALLQEPASSIAKAVLEGEGRVTVRIDSIRNEREFPELGGTPYDYFVGNLAALRQQDQAATLAKLQEAGYSREEALRWPYLDTEQGWPCIRPEHLIPLALPEKIRELEPVATTEKYTYPGYVGKGRKRRYPLPR